jgi:hypothetical protein
VKSFFDFIGRTEIEMCSRLPRNAETGDSDKEALFASAGGVEVSEFLGGTTRQASRGARRWSWTILKVNFIRLFYQKMPDSFNLATSFHFKTLSWHKFE